MTAPQNPQDPRPADASAAAREQQAQPQHSDQQRGVGGSSAPAGSREAMTRSATPWYRRDAVKFPLTFAFMAGLVAGVVAAVSAAGGLRNGARLDIGFIAFGVAFIVSLVVAAMLQIVEKPNDPELSAGSGINRRSSDIPGGASNVPDPWAERGHDARVAAAPDADAAAHENAADDAASASGGERA